MVDHTEPPYFLKLPLELREQIYKEVLADPSNGPQLLSTCREIYTEAYKHLFKRPLIFRGQSILYQWLEQVPSQHLQHVTEISLEIHDTDLRSLIAPTTGAVKSSTTPPLQAWDLYNADLAELRKSTAKLKSIKFLKVRALSESRSHFYREFLAEFLVSLGDIWPDLQGLTLDGNFHHQNLSFLSTLPELRSLSFDGFSSTPPGEMASLLSGLQRLESLSLVSQHSMLTPTNHFHSIWTSKRQSFTNDVLLRINPLASFSVTERIHPSSAPALFFTPEMLETLHKHSALKRLTICLSQNPDTAMLEAMEAFLAKSSIERLELDWPKFDTQEFETYSMLPSTLKWFWVRVPSMPVAFNILDTILDSLEGGDMGNLKKIVLLRSEESFDAEPTTTHTGSEDVEEASNEVSQDPETPRVDGNAGADRADRTTGQAEADTDLGSELKTIQDVEGGADTHEHTITAGLRVEPMADPEPREDTEVPATKIYTEGEEGTEAQAIAERGAQSCEDTPSHKSTVEDEVAERIQVLNEHQVQVVWCTYDP